MTSRLVRGAISLLALTAAVVAGLTAAWLLSDWAEPDVKFFQWQVDPDWLGGLLLAGAGIFVGIGIAAFAFRRQPRLDRDSDSCPRCGGAVGRGVPTCLNCGYNLLRG